MVTPEYLWKMSRIVPVLKNRPSEPNDFQPVALTSPLMKTLERLFLSLLGPQVQQAQDCLQFAYQPGVAVGDAILDLLHPAHSHLDKGSGTVRISFWTPPVPSILFSPLCFGTNRAWWEWTPTWWTGSLTTSLADHSMLGWRTSRLTWWSAALEPLREQCRPLSSSPWIPRTSAGSEIRRGHSHPWVHPGRQRVLEAGRRLCYMVPH